MSKNNNLGLFKISKFDLLPEMTENWPIRHHKCGGLHQILTQIFYIAKIKKLQVFLILHIKKYERFTQRSKLEKRDVLVPPFENKIATTS
jgi:hypothetical protein